MGGLEYKFRDFGLVTSDSLLVTVPGSCVRPSSSLDGTTPQRRTGLGTLSVGPRGVVLSVIGGKGICGKGRWSDRTIRSRVEEDCVPLPCRGRLVVTSGSSPGSVLGESSRGTSERPV